MKIKLSLIAATAVLLSGCMHQVDLLTPQGQAVQIVDQKPVRDCEFLGPVEGKRDTFFTGVLPYSELVREAKFDLLNNAAAMKANVVYNIEDTGNGVLSALAPLPIVLKAEAYHCTPE